MLGSWQARYYWTRRGVFTKILAVEIALCGVLDFHSHVRFRAIKRYFQESAITVDLGAGEGNIAVEFTKLMNGMCVAVSYDSAEVDKILNIKHLLDVQSKLQLILADASTCFLRKGSVGQVLLIDVLEHIADENAVLDAVILALEPGGYLLLSVPTNEYVRYFGTDYDRRIGHIRHYSPEDLRAILSRHGFKTIGWEYHTTPFEAWLCGIWYQGIPRLNGIETYVRMLVLPIFEVLTSLGRLRGLVRHKNEKDCAGFVMLARKNPHVANRDLLIGNVPLSSTSNLGFP